MDSDPLVETSGDVWFGAMDLCVAHTVSSEDLNPGFHWGGVRVVNPFALPLDPLLLSVLGSRRPSGDTSRSRSLL